MNLLRGTFMGLLCLVAGLLVVWQPLPTLAQAAAPVKGKPALYEFGAGYCVSCKEMAKIMAELQPLYGDQLEVRLVYWSCPLFGTILNEKISLFPIFGFMVYSACPPGD